MEKRKPIRVFGNGQSCFVHQLADGEVCQQKPRVVKILERLEMAWLRI